MTIRLNEIFEHTPKVTKSDIYTAIIPDHLIGSGYFSQVYVADPDNPHEVIKISGVPIAGADRDPYVNFVLKLLNNPDLAENNLYLPRVYEVHLSKNQSEIMLENLEILRMVEFELLSVWADKTFVYTDRDGKPADLIAGLKQRYLRATNYTIPYLEDVLLVAISKMAKNQTKTVLIDYALGFADLEVTCQDEKLLEALGVWRRILATTHGARWDVTEHNIMWRRTSVGGQPVFTDLLAPAT